MCPVRSVTYVSGRSIVFSAAEYSAANRLKAFQKQRGRGEGHRDHRNDMSSIPPYVRVRAWTGPGPRWIGAERCRGMGEIADDGGSGWKSLVNQTGYRMSPSDRNTGRASSFGQLSPLCLRSSVRTINS